MIGTNGREDVQEVQMLWETGAVTTESFEFLAKEIPVELAVYAKANNLLEEKGWRQFKRLAKQDYITERLVKQAKLRSFRVSPKYKYGFEVPRNFIHARSWTQRMVTQNG